MGVHKIRRRAQLMGSATFVGSVQHNAPLDVNTVANFLGTEVHSGVVTEQGSINFAGGLKTFNAQTRVNTPVLAPAGSANTQYAGFTRLNSGATSVTVSTTVVKSNTLFLIGAPILAAVIPTAHQASGSIPGGIVVSTITEANFFVLGWQGGVGYGAPVDIPWKIELQA